MPDDPRIPRDDEDAAFRDWLHTRPNQPEDVPASVTFMEIMRQAAARSSTDQGDPVRDAADSRPDDATTPYVSPEDRPPPSRRRRTSPPPLTSADISAAVRAAGEEFARAAESTPKEAAPKPAAAKDEPPVDSAPHANEQADIDRPPTQARRRMFQRAPASPSEPLPPLSLDSETDATDAGVEAPSDAPTVEVNDLSASSDDQQDEQAALDAPDADPNVTLTESPPTAALRLEERAKARERLLEQRRARAARQRQRPANAVGGFIRSFILVFAAAGLIATIFTWWTPPRFINDAVSQQLSMAMETSGAADAAPREVSTVIPTPNWALRIGVVSGHRGNDPGAVCDDGLREADVNFSVASQVVDNLRAVGYTVDLLDEFDPRLTNYEAVALVSIHANSCQDYGYRASGFLISAAAARPNTRSVDDLLVECIARSYQATSGLERLPGVTIDMSDYHAFREIGAQTPATIIELGFLRADRELLTTRATDLARSITDGVLCFVEPARDVLAPTATPTLPVEQTEAVAP